MQFSKKVLSQIFIALNITVVLIYLLTCFLPWLDAGEFWFIAILGLLFPILFVAVVILFIIALMFRSKWCLLSLVALLFSWQQIAVAFSWHLPRSFSYAKSKETLRVFQWNVSSWDEMNKAERGGITYRGKMFAEIKKSQADILCFEEFLETKDTAWFAATIPELQKMGYAYHYFLPTYAQVYNTDMGMVILSKYPITNTGFHDFGAEESAQQLIYADIQFKQQKIRVIALHLQSVHFEKQEYKSLDEIKRRDKTGLKDSRTIVGKLKKGYQFRKQQADIVKDYVDKSPYPVIICGDFNDVPNSYTYFTVRGNMQDAFLQKGSGIGRSFRFISPTLRIDYILADKKFDVTQYHRLTVPYSDHYGIMADMQLNQSPQ